MSETAAVASCVNAENHFRGNLDNWDSPVATDWQTRLAQYDAVCTWGQPNHSLLERVSALDKPVFVPTATATR